VDACGDLPAARSRLDDERASIGGADVSGDQPALGEPIEDARERRSFVRQAAVQAGDRRRTRRGEVRQDVRLALRQSEVTELRQIKADAVGRSVDWRDEA